MPHLLNLDGTPLDWPTLHARNEAWHAEREREETRHERVRSMASPPREPFVPDTTPIGQSTHLFPVTWSDEELAEWEAKVRAGTLFSDGRVLHVRRPGAVVAVIEHGSVRSYIAGCRCGSCTASAVPYLDMLGLGSLAMEPSRRSEGVPEAVRPPLDGGNG